MKKANDWKKNLEELAFMGEPMNENGVRSHYYYLKGNGWDEELSEVSFEEYYECYQKALEEMEENSIG